MRVVVTGASGNLGTALLRHLAASHPEWDVTGVCRRPPHPGDPAYDRVRWVRADLGADATAVLDDVLDGADAVVHLAWQIQPSRDPDRLQRVNVGGSRQVLDAARRRSVPHLVHASSVGAYAPGPKDRAVDESHPATGVACSSYSRQKAVVETYLDRLGTAAGAPAVARIRPGLVFQGDAGSEIARYFLGPLVPNRLVGARRLPLVPLPVEAVFQAVHAADVADAVTRILDRRAAGPFNLAATPVMTPRDVAAVFRGRWVRVPRRVLRAGADLTWRARLQPTEPGWVDLALGAPVMATARARDELGWLPHHDARSALVELLEGMGRGAGTRSPALAPRRRLARLGRLPLSS